MKALLFLALLANPVAAMPALRFVAPAAVEEEEALDLVIDHEGERRLFPLLPGTKCPPGHQCRARTFLHTGGKPSAPATAFSARIKDNLKTPLTALQAHHLDNDLNTAVESSDSCVRRSAISRAVGIAAGLLVSTVNMPAFAVETKTVGMGTESGQLIFDPPKLSICKGDTVNWVIVKGGPHNVIFDEEAIPSGVKSEEISMEDQMGEEGESFSKTFSTAGVYGYYCEPHRSAGMQGELTVKA